MKVRFDIWIERLHPRVWMRRRIGFAQEELKA
jgi:hypothetical protein